MKLFLLIILTVGPGYAQDRIVNANEMIADTERYAFILDQVHGEYESKISVKERVDALCLQYALDEKDCKILTDLAALHGARRNKIKQDARVVQRLSGASTGQYMSELRIEHSNIVVKFKAALLEQLSIKGRDSILKITSVR